MSEPAADVLFVEGPASNWILLRRAAQFTLIDGGYRGDLPLVLASIRDAGLDPADAVAVLITHAHVDHTGAAAYFSREYGTPVLSSAAEHKHLSGEEKFSVTPLQVLFRAWQPRVFRWARHVLRSGGPKGIPVRSAAVWTDDLLAGLPGRPVAVPTPGHTPGHTAFYLPDAKAVVTGDALVTGHAISARSGPQLLHSMFHYDGARVDTALAVLAGLDACLLLPGHGPALRAGIRDAVDTARSRQAAKPGKVVVPGARKAGWAGEPNYGRMEPGGDSMLG
ncbi:MBL fold metallo-hydrolase [Arthrobacter sp. zg-Y1110]|nr:MBL fold metallo-hydrolase [Arthrobacter sp. zg-Y1110]UWX85570.1 MBL fold metallo-hydrolase [Arthrobacter sp. zg-Y1110]